MGCFQMRSLLFVSLAAITAAWSTQEALQNFATPEINDHVTSRVLCNTTAGPLSIDVRAHWAPRGAARFLSLVTRGHFSALPFFRVCPRYITQFGVKRNAARVPAIKDDANLWGVRDMGRGHVFFAGSGPNSRGNQMVIAFCQTEGCVRAQLGKAPWEVPLGTIAATFEPTLAKIEQSGRPYPSLEMPGLAEGAKGPDQSRIATEPGYLEQNYPQIESFLFCEEVAVGAAGASRRPHG